MAEDGQGNDQLRDEFEKLGGNLRSLIQGAWESEERKRASMEVQSGLKQVGDAISRAAHDLSQDPTAQKVRQEVDEIAERIRSGEIGVKVSSELIDVLQQVNQRLEDIVTNLEEAMGEDPDSKGESD